MSLKLCRVRLIIDHNNPAPVVAVAESTVELVALPDGEMYRSIDEQPEGDIRFGESGYVPKYDILTVEWDVWSCDTEARPIFLLQTYCLPSQLASAKAFIREAAKKYIKLQIKAAKKNIKFYKSQLDQI